MAEILYLDHKTLYVEHPRWQCRLGERAVKLGMIFEAVVDGRGDYPVVVDASLLPQPEELDREIVDQAREEGIEDRKELILEVYRYRGGVPFNVDAIQAPKSSCGFSSFVAETSISAVEVDGKEMEIRHFPSVEEALQFTRDFYAVYSHGLFTFLDAVLDNPLPGGLTGREKIRSLIGDQGD
ncbi:MAG: hypothetical protein GKC10_06405 [Methanosarcinales archaeon]|nr:hypothetical protein [Methanosarcinales archaeon]